MNPGFASRSQGWQQGRRVFTYWYDNSKYCLNPISFEWMTRIPNGMTICLFLFTTWFQPEAVFARFGFCSQASLPMASPCGVVRGWVQRCGSSAETKVAWPGGLCISWGLGLGWAPSSENFDEISVPYTIPWWVRVSQSSSIIFSLTLPANLGLHIFHLFPTAKSSNHQITNSALEENGASVITLQRSSTSSDVAPCRKTRGTTI